MKHSTLVGTAALAENLSAWRVFDCRHDLARPHLGETQYREAHVPGAVFAHLDRDLSGPKTGQNGRHPLPAARTFIDWLGKQGLERSDQVVCYDAGNGTMAARLWWMLRWVGHEAVAVLEGGFAKWRAEARPISAALPVFAPTQYAGQPRDDDAVDGSFIERERSRLLLLDARAPARFRGEHEPIDPVAGRIPGAMNRFCTENLRPDGTFKDAGQLRSEFLSLLGDRTAGEVVNYCGSGVAACHNLLAMELAGLAGARLYPGSWSEWIADPSRARERG
jgi:thiosulfate/3-mercaptopyruvate sulfurtransferase